MGSADSNCPTSLYLSLRALGPDAGGGLSSGFEETASQVGATWCHLANLTEETKKSDFVLTGPALLSPMRLPRVASAPSRARPRDACEGTF